MTKRQYTRLKFKVEITSSPFGTHEGPELHPKKKPFPLHTKNLYKHYKCSYCIFKKKLWMNKRDKHIFNELLNFI